MKGMSISHLIPTHRLIVLAHLSLVKPYQKNLYGLILDTNLY
jgi:hypothetical protein